MKHPYEIVKKYIYENPNPDYLDECSLFFFLINTVDNSIEKILFEYPDWEEFYRDFDCSQSCNIISGKIRKNVKKAKITKKHNTSVSERIIFPFTLQIISPQNTFYTFGKTFEVEIENADFDMNEQTKYFSFINNTINRKELSIK